MNRKDRRIAAKGNSAESLARLAMQLAQRGDSAGAISKYRQALEIRPQFFEALTNLGNLLRDDGHLDEAARLYGKSIGIRPHADTFNSLGVCILRSGDFSAAVVHFENAIRLRPSYPQAYSNLGMALAGVGRTGEAIAVYRRALELDAGFVAARINLGLALADAGLMVEALEQAEIASAAATMAGFPHYRLGTLLARCGCDEGARVCFEAYLRDDPADREGVRILLANQGYADLPARASAAVLDRIYNNRAASWDAGAGGETGYLGAELVVNMLQRLAGDRELADIADAGCGTGLVGDLLGKSAGQLIGIDMSAAMLGKAKEKGTYRKLHEGDLVEVLNSYDARFDAITCAATLIHFGDLKPAFDAAAHALRDGGLFVMTLFPNDRDANSFAAADREGLANGGCYMHGHDYVADVAQAAGFAVEAIETGTHEYSGGQPVMGLIVGLRRVRMAVAGAA